MNRLEMKETIEARVPLLSARDGGSYKKAEELRKAFVRDYHRNRIASLGLDGYVIGKGKQNRSFCYRIEREMDSLGRILGATALKFGVYYGRTKREASEKYRFAKHWGISKDEAFNAVRGAIVDLLDAAEADDTIPAARLTIDIWRCHLQIGRFGSQNLGFGLSKSTIDQLNALGHC